MKSTSIKAGRCAAAQEVEMNFQVELRSSKQIVRGWVRTNFSDQKLASVLAFNADGRMSFRNPYGCLMGVTYSDRLHMGHDCDREHYWIARPQELGQTRRFAALPRAEMQRRTRLNGFALDNAVASHPCLQAAS